MSKLAGATFVGAVASIMAVVVARHDPSSTDRQPAPDYRPAAYACDFTRQGVPLHAAASADSASIGEGYPGDGFSVIRWHARGAAWVYGSDTTTGRTGWVYGGYLSTACQGEGS
jgi:hypothetical protein